VMSQRIGFRRHYRMAPWSDSVEVHWGDGCQVYVTPVGGDEVCVAAITGKRGVHFEEVLGQFPWLLRRLAEKETFGRERGAVTTTRRLDRVTRGNVALVGDASGSVDAITGEGLALGFRQALLLADALGNDDLAHYEAGYASIVQLPRRMAAIMAAMDRSERLRDCILRTLAVHPELFARTLRVHVGELTPMRFLVVDGLRLVSGLFMSGISMVNQPA